MRAHLARAAAAALAAALVATGCSGNGDEGGRQRGAPRPPAAGGSSEASPDTASGLPARIARQHLTWEHCTPDDTGLRSPTLRPDADCAWLTVPVDYADPGKSTLKIRVARVRAPTPDRRLGSLVFNPGGPGEAGAQMIAGGAFEATGAVMGRYDLIGFDPRGIGRSAPLKCPEGAGGDLIPRTREQADAEFKAAADQGENCRKAAGALLAHMDTVSVARDLDLLRASLGERTLNYLGYSYGTYIGQHYAHLFPGRVGRFVLDSVVDPGTDQVQTARDDVRALGDSFASYARNCAQNQCPLGGTPEEVVAKTTDFVRGLDAHPVPGPAGSRLTTGLAAQGIREPLYQADRWPDLTAALTQAMAGSPGALIALAAEQVQSARGEETEETDADPTMARNAVDCLDKPGPRTAAELLVHLAEFEKSSPLFGASVAATMFHCAAWPIAPTGKAEPLTAPGAPPVVLVSYAVDPATPLANAQTVRKNLGSASLVVRDGTGHAAYGSGSECTDQAVETFLTDGTLPPTDLRCPA